MKKINKKNILTYLICLLPWFIGSILFKIDTTYYKNLNLPFFAPSPIIFPIIWTLLYLLISFSIYKTKEEKTTNYSIYLTINYLSNQLFTFFFFIIKNNFLALIDTLIVFLSSIYLYQETKKINKNNTKYLIPYLIWNLFALILITTIYIIN